MSIEWYVVYIYVGQEDWVQDQFMDCVCCLGMYCIKIFQVFQFEEEVVEIQEGGKKVNVKCKLFFGYVFVQMDVEDDDVLGEFGEFWEVVCGISGVIGFVGMVICLVFLLFEEVQCLLILVGVVVQLVVEEVLCIKVDFKVGDMVCVIFGFFVDFSGVVSEVNVFQVKVKVFVSIFGCEMLVEFDFLQVVK